MGSAGSVMIFLFVFALWVFLVLLMKWSASSRDGVAIPWSAAWRTALDEAAASRMGAKAVKGKRWTWAGILDGRDFRYRLWAGNRDQLSNLTMTIAAPPSVSGSFLVRREEEFDRMAKDHGVADEVQTGDAGFDRQFYIETDHGDFTRAYFQIPDHRAAVADIFQKGVKSVALTRDGFVVIQEPLDGDSETISGLVQAVIPDMMRLCRDIPQGIHGRRSRPRLSSRFKEKILYGLCVAGLIIGFFIGIFSWETFRPLDGWQVFLFSLMCSLPAGLIGILMVKRWFAGDSRSHTVLAMHALWILGGAVLVGFGLTMAYNAVSDNGPSAAHHVRVWSKREASSGDSRSYYIVVDSWRVEGDRKELEIERGLYRHLDSQHSRVEVITRPGALGFEWIVDVRNATE